jgi:cob(I)alamin adenosyltransferase
MGQAVGMVRINRVYTRAGDDGTTALVGGQRVPKDSIRIEAYGTVDELNSVVGVAIASNVSPRLVEPLQTIQQVLFNLGSQLALDAADAGRIELPSVTMEHVSRLEKLMDEWNDELPDLKSFVLPGGTVASAQLQVARTVCRRAERVILALRREEAVEPQVIAYVNRLSDLLFVAARVENADKGEAEVLWDSRAF